MAQRVGRRRSLGVASVALLCLGGSTIAAATASGSVIGSAIPAAVVLPSPSPTDTIPADPIVPLAGGAIAYSSQGPNASSARLVLLDPGGPRTLVSGGRNTEPTWSPDGKQLAFVSNREGFTRGGIELAQMYVISRSGGAPSRISDPSWGYTDPAWSPDGASIAYVRFAASGDGGSSLWIADSDGANPVLLSSQDFADYRPTWSPDGTRMAYVCRGPLPSYESICQINRDGTARADVIDTDGFVSDLAWRGDTLHYILTNGQSSAWDYDETTGASSQQSRPAYLDDSWSTDGTVQVAGSGNGLRVVTNGADVGILADTTSASQSPAIAPGDFVLGAPVPSAPPVIAGLRVGNARPSDRLLQRALNIDVAYNNSLVDHFEYGWADSKQATAPSGLTQQSASALATLDFSQVTPDSDWYLMARAVLPDGSTTGWTRPKRVHTPRAGLVVVTGDSYNSGHHQGSDDALCPLSSDIAIYFDPTLVPALCSLQGRPAVEPNDPGTAWGCQLANNLNAQLPPQWAMSCDFVAQSGAATSSFGDPSLDAVDAAWAAGGLTQAGRLRTDLAAHSTGWNVVTLSGGADDIDFVSTLTKFYGNNYVINHYLPWSVPRWQSCPDGDQQLWARSQDAAVQTAIASNLTGMIRTAIAAAPGVRIVDITYPYTVDQGNPCFGNHGSWHGQRDIVDTIDKIHVNLRFSATRLLTIDLRKSAAFGKSPVANGEIQLTRFYGYPHPSSAGQSDIASLATEALLK
jgi:hypothetical protein